MLQIYLLRQQYLAGIQPENMIRMRPRTHATQGQSSSNNPNNPNVVQISNSGLVVPQIPPATFKGVLQPLPDQRAGGYRPPVMFPRPVVSNSRHVPDICAASQPHNNKNTAHVQQAVALTAGPSQKIGNAPRVVQGGVKSKSSQGSVKQKEKPQGVSQGQKNDQAQYRLQMAPTIARAVTRNVPPLSSSGVAEGPKTKDVMEGKIPHNNFDILLAFTYHEMLLLRFTTYLGVQDIVKFVKKHYADVIVRQAVFKTPESARIFPFSCYPDLCRIVTNARQQSGSTRNAGDQTRTIPSFRWLFMITYRETVVQEIMRLMFRVGHAVPQQCASAIRKIWFLMDIRDNKRRLWTVQNPIIWGDTDIFFATLFITKLDMALRTKYPNITGRMFRLMLAQPTLTELKKALSKPALRSELDILKAYVRWKYTPLDHEKDMWIYGVPPQEVGSLQFEGYRRGERPIELRRPDELILGELGRRQLKVGHIYRDMFVQGNGARYAQMQGLGRWDEEIKSLADREKINWNDAVRLK
ncbi:hypothetical protein BDV25DRAFT_172329 [Aspergillus avenaceus]|uniref:Uncharacterized protein n=1 Tax=Aspergillus avenaceus TaxID=36643 RepID=A0A5N6TUZ1_ASPAV|nr:hypothetical protein BDV25DRAFT_172329 [Aspergillus avenaceus]